jgi:predicted nucleic acid-binding protein
MLLDSNIIIYAAQPQHQALRAFVATHAPAVSAISYVEVLGYHRLSESDREILGRVFATARVLPLDPPVLDRAVALRQQRRISLGDALIAATALVHGLTLVTRNVGDFEWIQRLTLIDPLAPDSRR